MQKMHGFLYIIMSRCQNWKRSMISMGWHKVHVSAESYAQSEHLSCRQVVLKVSISMGKDSYLAGKQGQ